MAETSRIEWTDATWNPITGCSVVSPGCTNCYAMKLAGTRLKNHPSRAGLTQLSKAGPVWTGEVRLNEAWLADPLKWTRPRRIFVCAHGDLFHEAVPDAWIDCVLAVMALCPHHVFQVLTKRAARMRAYLSDVDLGLRIAALLMDSARGNAAQEAYVLGAGHALTFGPGPKHIWLGVSVEDQTRADERREDLAALARRGWTTFVSYEPALGPVDWRGWEFLSWLICGGENGPRPMHPDWARSARDFCSGAGIPFFFKQWGSWISVLDRDLQDPDWRADYPQYEREGCRWLNLAGGHGFHGERLQVMRKVGKAVAGRLLDGVEHNGMPA